MDERKKGQKGKRTKGPKDTRTQSLNIIEVLCCILGSCTFLFNVFLLPFTKVLGQNDHKKIPNIKVTKGKWSRNLQFGSEIVQN